MDIYAPLAERIGMYEMMTEMQTPRSRNSSRMPTRRSPPPHHQQLKQNPGGTSSTALTSAGSSCILPTTASKPK